MDRTMALSTKVTTEKKTRMYEGKVVRRFMKDKAGPTEYLEVECLKYTPAAPVILEKIPSYEQQDNDVIPIWDVIAGPLIVTPEVQAPTSTYLHSLHGGVYLMDL